MSMWPLTKSDSDLNVYDFELGWWSMLECLPDTHKPLVPFLITQTTEVWGLPCDHPKSLHTPALVRKDYLVRSQREGKPNPSPCPRLSQGQRCSLWPVVLYCCFEEDEALRATSVVLLMTDRNPRIITHNSLL